MTPERAPKGPAIGVLQWFRLGDHAAAEAAIDQIERLGIEHLRTGISWADYHEPEGEAWYDWLLPRLARSFDLLPCLTYTPPSISMGGTSASPPRRLKDYADFMDLVLTRHGRHFSHVELWNEPNNLNDWDWRYDPGWHLFSEMAGMAAHWARHRGWKVVLGGMCPVDTNWLGLLAQRGLLAQVDVVGVHGFPGTWDSCATRWSGWDAAVSDVRRVLKAHRLEPEIWITECGYSTWRHHEAGQVESFIDAIEAPVERTYWYGLRDIDPAHESQEGFHFDERHYHLGLFDAEDRPKLLARTLEHGGVAEARLLRDRCRRRPAHASGTRPALILGGAGFLGANLADRLAEDGRDVVIVDALHRDGVTANLDWLHERHGDRIAVEIADIRDRHVLRDLLPRAEAVFHFAAQVAVTTSLLRPWEDFSINAMATVGLLESLRMLDDPPPLFFASTNKVYGNLADVALAADRDRHWPTDSRLAARGVDETRALDLHSPYGCSKGAADQYVLDYARSFGLRAVVMRMSCLYGPRQFGTEDQGWVAHFVLSALRRQPIVIYGDGRQVRDILHVDDAVAAYLAAWQAIDRTRGHAFNLGGGPANAVSLRQVIGEIEHQAGHRLKTTYAPIRTGDQAYYVSDTSRLTAATGWNAKLPWREGITDLMAWAEAFLESTAQTRGEGSRARRTDQSALAV